MNRPLLQKIEQLDRHARLTSVVYGVSRTICLVLLAALLVSSIDYLFQLSGMLFRASGSLVVLTVLIVSVCRWLLPCLVGRLNPVDLSRLVARRFPELSEQLPSAVDCSATACNDADSRQEVRGEGTLVNVARRPTGRASFRSRTIDRAEKLCRDYNFLSVIDTRPARRWLSLAVISVLLFTVLMIVSPIHAWTAVSRLIMPWSSSSWPTRHHLKLVEPVEQVARGGNALWMVYDDRGMPLPEDLEIHFRSKDSTGRTLLDTHRMMITTVAEIVSDQSGQFESAVRPFSRLSASNRQAATGSHVGYYEQANVVSPLEYRITGGDDRDMPWQRVQLVTPPRIVSLQTVVTPPSYAGLPSRSSDGDEITGPVGSTVEIRAVASVALADAQRIDDDGRSQDCRITGSGRNMIETSFSLDVSGTFDFQLTDAKGVSVRSARAWVMRAEPDSPPLIDQISPTGNRHLLNTARLQIQADVSDDLGLATADLRYSIQKAPGRIGGDAIANRLLLWSPDDRIDRSERLPDRHLKLDYTWDIATLALSPGDQLSFVLSFQDSAGQQTDGPTFRMEIITPEEMKVGLDSQIRLIQDELRDAWELEKRCRDATVTLLSGGSLQGSGSVWGSADLPTSDANREEQVAALDNARRFVKRLGAIRYDQSRVRTMLTDQSRGVAGVTVRMLEDMQTNRQENFALYDVIQRLYGTLVELDQEQLEPIASLMDQGMRQATIQMDLVQDSVSNDSVLSEGVGRTHSYSLSHPRMHLPPSRSWAVISQTLHRLPDVQAEALHKIASMQEMLNQQVIDRSRLSGLQQIMDRQSAILQATATLAQETMLKPQDRLTSQNQLEENRLADQQRRVVTDLQGVLTSDYQQALTSEDSKMLDTGRYAAEAIAAHRLAQSIDYQRQLLAQLAEYQAAGANVSEASSGAGRNGTSAPGSSSAQLESLRRDVEHLATDQQQLARETTQIDTTSGEQLDRLELLRLVQLASDQRELRQQCDAIGVQWSDEPQVKTPLSEAASSMLVAENRLNLRRTDRETQQSQQEAIRQLRQLLKTLDQLADELQDQQTDNGKQAAGANDEAARSDEAAEGNADATQSDRQNDGQEKQEPGDEADGTNDGSLTPGEGTSPASPGELDATSVNGMTDVDSSSAADRMADARAREYRRELLNSVWGRLPDSARQRILQQSDGEFLPGYERLIEAYFQRLNRQDTLP